MRPIVRNSSGAVEGLPLQLIITAVVLAITIPIMFGALRTYDRSKVDTQLQNEINEFISTAQMIYISGPGNSARIDFDAENGAFTSIEYIKFGDSQNGDYLSVIRYLIDGKQEVPVVLKNPNVPLMSSEGNELTIMPGQYEIIVECVSSQFDINDDGLAPDNFIQLSISGV